MIKTARQLKAKKKLRRFFQKKFSYAADLSWHTVMESVRSLYRLAQEQVLN